MKEEPPSFPSLVRFGPSPNPSRAVWFRLVSSPHTCTLHVFLHVFHLVSHSIHRQAASVNSRLKFNDDVGDWSRGFEPPFTGGVLGMHDMSSKWNFRGEREEGRE